MVCQCTSRCGPNAQHRLAQPGLGRALREARVQTAPSRTVSLEGSTRRIGLWLVGGIAGSVVFWLVQVLTGGPTTTKLIGQPIAAARGYPQASAPLIGWAVHLGVSLAYAALMGIVGNPGVGARSSSWLTEPAGAIIVGALRASPLCGPSSGQTFAAFVTIDSPVTRRTSRIQ